MIDVICPRGRQPATEQFTQPMLDWLSTKEAIEGEGMWERSVCRGTNVEGH
jgi:hypothetical protein